MEEAPRRPVLWLVVIGCALGAFLYVAVYDVARVHARGPSLAGEELVVLARHGRITRGGVVRCDDHGEAVIGSVVALPGELALASAAGVRVPRKAESRFGAPLERRAAVAPTAGGESEAERAVVGEPGEILVAVADSSTPRALRAAKCLPVVRRVRLGVTP